MGNQNFKIEDINLQNNPLYQRRMQRNNIQNTFQPIDIDAIESDASSPTEEMRERKQPNQASPTDFGPFDERGIVFSVFERLGYITGINCPMYAGSDCESLWRHIKHLLTTVEKQLELAAEQDSLYNAKVDKCKALNAMIQQRNMTFECARTTWNRKLNELTDDNKKLTDQLFQSEQINKKINEDLKAFEVRLNNLANIETNLNSLHEKLMAEKTFNDTIDSELDRQIEQLEQNHRDIDACNEEIAQLKMDKLIVTDKVEDLETKLKIAEMKIQCQDSDIQMLNNDLSNYQLQCDNLTKENKALVKEREDLEGNAIVVDSKKRVIIFFKLAICVIVMSITFNYFRN